MRTNQLTYLWVEEAADPVGGEGAADHNEQLVHAVAFAQELHLKAHTQPPLIIRSSGNTDQQGPPPGSPPQAGRSSLFPKATSYSPKGGIKE